MVDFLQFSVNSDAFLVVQFLTIDCFLPIKKKATIRIIQLFIQGWKSSIFTEGNQKGPLFWEGNNVIDGKVVECVLCNFMQIINNFFLNFRCCGAKILAFAMQVSYWQQQGSWKHILEVARMEFDLHEASKSGSQLIICSEKVENFEELIRLNSFGKKFEELQGLKLALWFICVQPCCKM